MLVFGLAPQRNPAPDDMASGAGSADFREPALPPSTSLTVRRGTRADSECRGKPAYAQSTRRMSSALSLSNTSRAPRSCNVARRTPRRRSRKGSADISGMAARVGGVISVDLGCEGEYITYDSGRTREEHGRRLARDPGGV